LSVQTLVDHAKYKSQAHLLAISQRKSLHEDITDVLVVRGSQDVVRSVARNVGARFSESGFWRLVQRSEDDILLALDVGARRDMPRHHFQRLIAKASDEAKARLVALTRMRQERYKALSPKLQAPFRRSSAPGQEATLRQKRLSERCIAQAN